MTGKSESVPSPRPEYSRDWGEYLVKAVLSEEIGNKAGLEWPDLTKEEIAAHRSSINNQFECHVLLLSVPIVVKTAEVTEIITIRDGKYTARIYPPFPVNEKGEAAGALDGISIPEGTQTVASYTPIPSSAVKGVRVEPTLKEGALWCRGLRIDVQNGASSTAIAERLLEHICQYTHQWWIRAPYNPFLGMKRLGASVNHDFQTMEAMRYRGAGTIESFWYGAVQSQPALGVGGPLTKGSWRLSCIHTGDGRKADQGILAFHDGFASYMARQDERCILNLALATEILLNKHWIAVQRKRPEKLEKLIRISPLVNGEIRHTLGKLCIDRGHVAHGREPYHLGRDDAVKIEDYIDALRILISRYFASIPQGDWPDIMTMAISR